MSAGNLACALAGIGLIVLTLLDVVRTVLTARGSGPVTRHLASTLWSSALRLHRRRPFHPGLGAMGVVVLLVSYVVWVGGLWAGWAIVFTSQPDAILEAQSRDPAGHWQRVYYVGYSLTTLGIGDYVAGSPAWQLATVLVALTGFTVLTLSATYLISVLSALTQKRAFGHYVSALGGTPAAIVANQWRGHNCEALLAHVPTLTALVETITHQHAAYPVLHYFHASERDAALPLRLAALHETFLLLESGAVPCAATSHGVQPLRRSVNHFLAQLDEAHLARTGNSPPPPALENLAHHSETGEGTDIKNVLRARQHERDRLLRYVVHDGWAWDDVHAGTQTAHANREQHHDLAE